MDGFDGLVGDMLD